jgi:tripeptidyl-peptidase I
MKEHIDFITPGVGLASSQQVRRQAKAEKRDKTCPSNGATTLGFKPAAQIPKNFQIDKCSEGVFPACINALYGVPTDAPCHSDSSVGIFSANHTYLQSDLDIFFEHFTSTIPAGTTPDTHFVNGGKLDSQFRDTDTFEADLDVEMAWPLVYPQNISFYDVNPSLIQDGDLLHLNISSYSDQSVLIKTVIDDLLGALDKVSEPCICTNKADKSKVVLQLFRA